ncbi:MAG: hypothetical protein ACREPQ_14295 [Rhodanobacter sp.]
MMDKNTAETLKNLSVGVAAIVAVLVAALLVAAGFGWILDHVLNHFVPHFTRAGDTIAGVHIPAIVNYAFEGVVGLVAVFFSLIILTAVLKVILSAASQVVRLGTAIRHGKEPKG